MSDQPSPARSVRRYVFYNEQRPSRAWMPTLEAINDRFSQHLRTALLQTLQPDIEVTPPVAIQLIKHSELTAKIATPCHLTLAGLKPLRGAILVVVDAALISWIVESRFGGDGRFPIPTGNREISSFEQKSARRLVQTIVDQFALAWQPITNMEPRILRHESNPQIVSIARPAEQVIVSAFEVQIGQGGGKLTICIPYLMLEPLHDQLVGELEEDVVDLDPRWQEALALGVGRATMTLRVELTKLQVKLGDLLDLRPGTVFDIDMPQIVSIDANEVPLFRGRWGKHGRKIAVRVEERLPEVAGLVTAGAALGEEGRHDAAQ
jgi:flagellar motor switch protein FliM